MLRSKTSRGRPSPFDDLEMFVPHDGQLQLNAAEFHSPGFWEFLGKLNPLEVIRQWCQDAHERRKDKEYREAADRNRLHWENELQKAKVIAQWIELLKGLGVPQSEIQRLVKLAILRPSHRLMRHINAGHFRNPRLELRKERKAE